MIGAATARFRGLLVAIRGLELRAAHRKQQTAQPELNREALTDLYEACREFVRRCDCGEVRSRRSYRQMKAAIEKAEATR